MLLSPFSSLLGETETIVTIYKHNTRYHNQHCRSNNEIVTNNMIMITIIKWYIFIGCKTTQCNLYPNLSLKYSNLFMHDLFTQKGRSTAPNSCSNCNLTFLENMGGLNALKQSRPGQKKILKFYPFYRYVTKQNNGWWGIQNVKR